MNLAHLPEREWRSYLLALGGMVAVSAGIVLAFRRKGWPGGDRGDALDR